MASSCASSGRPRVVDALAVLIHLFGARIEFTELSLDRAELFAQEVLALVLRIADAIARMAVRLGIGGARLQLAPQQSVDASQPCQRILGFQHLLGLGDPQAEIRGHQVGQAAGAIDVRRDRQDLGRQILQRQQFLDARPNRAHHRLGLDVPRLVLIARQRRDANPGTAALLDERFDRRTLEPLDENLEATVRHTTTAQHHRHRSHSVQIFGLGRRTLRIALRN